ALRWGRLSCLCRADVDPVAMSGRYSVALPATDARRGARRRGPIGRIAVMVLAFFAALLGAIVFMVDRVAAHGNLQQSGTQLAGAARVGTEVVRTLRAELATQADQLAGSRDLQRAIVTGNRAELQKLLRGRDASVRARGAVFGSLRQ